LNGGGLRVDSKEAHGLFNKTATAEGLSSNLAVGSGSDGSGAFQFGRSDPNSVVRTVRSGWARGDGGSAWGRTPACACLRSSRHRSGGKRSCACAQYPGKVEQASAGVVLSCRGAATAERRRNIGDGVPASGAAYGP
jgi:hypothetical protein